MIFQLSLEPTTGHWVRSTKFDPLVCALADRHYSRRPSSVGCGQVGPPGRLLVFLSSDGLAAWVSHWPKAELALDGIDAFRCSLFRNESPVLSSVLIAEARATTVESWGPPPSDGWLTYIEPGKIASANPGYCFKLDGWELDRDWSHRRLIRLRRPA